MYKLSNLVFTVVLLLHVVVEEGGTGLAAVVPVVVLGHEAADAGDGAVLAEADDLASVLDAVVLEGLEGDGLVDALGLLGLAVDLLFALLAAAAEAEDEVEGRLLLDVVIGKGPAVLELLAGEDEALLVRGNSLLVLDLGLHIVDGVRRLHIERDGLACCVLAGQTVHDEVIITRCIPDGRQSLTNANGPEAGRTETSSSSQWLGAESAIIRRKGKSHRWGEGGEEEAKFK